MSATNNPIEGGASTLPSETPGRGAGPVVSAPVAAELLPGSDPTAENPPWGVWEIGALIAITPIALTVAVLGTAFLVHHYMTPGIPWIESAKRPEMLIVSQFIAWFAMLVLMYYLAGSHGEPAETALRWNWPKAWPLFLGYGVVLNVSLTLLGHFLPMPKHLPIEDFFQTPREVWLISIFSVTLAPLFEELVFRGFIYPVVARWAGVAVSVGVTGLCFGLIHGWQLGFSWGPLLIIVMVGVVLSAVRAASKSLASTVLMHVGYNSTIGVLAFVATDGFRHLDKLR